MPIVQACFEFQKDIYELYRRQKEDKHIDEMPQLLEFTWSWECPLIATDELQAWVP